LFITFVKNFESSIQHPFKVGLKLFSSRWLLVWKSRGFALALLICT